ncbi:MAG: alcohol dehydrogenase catalytic domain-containing protein [Thaumarchaeota archaeon]|nr:alcohol dehydrogenase catalytic domain-containing protein [Nitrososphaerota archaeon]
MKAVAKVKREPGVEVIETEPDGIGDDEVLLKMRSASICGSDLGFYNFTAAYQKWAKIPVIMGHEFSGEVAEVGKAVSGFSRGDRVVCEPIQYCGSCRYCRMGITNICQNFTVLGMHRNGAFAEYVSVHEKYLHGVPDNVTFLEAAIVEPLSVVVNGLDEIADVHAGQKAAVVGPGPLGMFSAEVLRSKGISDITVIGIGIDEYRLGVARDKLGFRTVHWEKENAEELIKSSTDGYGCDIVVVTAGAPSALQQSIPLVAKGGQILVLGIFPDDVPLPVSDLVRRQVSMLSAYASRWIHFEQALRLLREKKVRADAIVTHRFTLDRAKEAFEMSKAKTGCKVQFYT